LILCGLTPRWSQQRLFLPLAVTHKFTLAVFRAVAQLWIVRPHSHATMTYRSSWWSRSGIGLVSILIAWILVGTIVPADYRGGGGAVAMVASVLAIFIYMAIDFVIKRRRKKDERDNDHAA